MTRLSFEDAEDPARILRNPGQGWYHHYLDNGTKKYLGTREDFEAFPGLSCLFIRLSWRHFEPERGRYDWSYIDRTLDEYAPLGYGVGLAFTCCETAQPIAVPNWLESEIDGEVVQPDGWTPYHIPNYGDAHFVQAYSEFLHAAGARYDAHPHVDWVQVASVGTWGEGHHWPASEDNVPDDVQLQHIELHHRAFPTTPVCLSDDVVFKADDYAAIRSAHESRGGFYTDHSPLVRYYIDNYGDTDCIRSPELFEETWRKRPTQIELDHLVNVAKRGDWPDPGERMVRSLVERTHTSWLGHHTDARDFVEDNRELAEDLARRLGARLVPVELEVDGSRVKLELKNLGVTAPHSIDELVLFDGRREVSVHGLNPSDWTPGSHSVEGLIQTPIKPVAVGLKARGRPFRWAVHEGFEDADGRAYSSR